MAIISPDPRTYCLNTGDTIAVLQKFFNPQPNKVWCKVVDGTHCPLTFCQNPYQAGATEVGESPTNSGEYPGPPYTVGGTFPRNAHVLFWWIFPNTNCYSFAKVDFSIAHPNSTSCSGIFFAKKDKRDKKGKQEAMQAKKKQKSKKKTKGAKA
jgi:hypothetical protein